MATASADIRSEQRRLADEVIAAEASLAPPELAPGELPKRVEDLLRPSRPVAVRGVVEGGVVRLLGGSAAHPERTKVIVVVAGGG